MRSLIAAFLVALAVAVPALAAGKHGIAPVAPKRGATVKAGSRPTFKGRVTGPGRIWVYVSRSPERRADGLIGHGAMIQRAKRDKHHFSVKAKYFDYPSFWLNRPGTYYWQAHRVACGEDGKDCYQEGPVVRFKVG